MNASQNAALLSRGLAEALDAGESVDDLAAQLNISRDEVLNRADNYRSRGISEADPESKASGYHFDSQILANGFNFAAQLAGRSYLKIKDRALKARASDIQDLISDARKAREQFISLVPFMDQSLFDDIVSEYCGLGRDWNASGKMVKEFAEANGVDQQLAADLVGRQMTVAQDYAQATRGLKFGRYVSWLHDAAAEANVNNMPHNIEEIVCAAYNRAAQWNQPADGLLIREFAETMGISEILPTWADCLKANMPSAEQAIEARKRIANRAAAAASAEQEAEQELIALHGSF